MVRPLVVALFLLSPAAALAQVGQLATAGEELRAAPDGAILATVQEGTPLALGRRQGTWQEVTLEGWIWHESVRAERNGPHDLVVSARPTENLRAAPNGKLLALVRTGMRLEQVERAGNWVRVRRTGWVRATAVRAAAAEVASQPAEAPPEQAAAPDPPTADTPPPTADAPPPATDAPPPATGTAHVGPGGAILLVRPGADTLARIRPGAAVALGPREGEWVRVRIDGWVPAASIGTAAAGDVLTDVTAAALAEDPGAFNGKVVEWDLQFIALQRAEPIRSDFRTGEHFMLTRGPAGEGGFVYVAVPAELVPEVERLEPLRRIRVRARVRNAHSPLTEAPILELLELRRRGSTD